MNARVPSRQSNSLIDSVEASLLSCVTGARRFAEPWNLGYKLPANIGGCTTIEGEAIEL